MSRRGFALAELLVALVIAGIIGIALTRLVVSQARFVSVQGGMMQARSGARAALNVMAEELRMVSDSGLLAATRDSITVRAPYGFGIACGYNAGRTIVGLLPADSAGYASASNSGVAWRDSLGNWRYLDAVAVSAGAPTTTCTTQTPAIAVLSAGSWSAQAIYAQSVAPTIGSPVYLYQKITYVFAASVDLPGRRALWRAVPGLSLREELVAPFDTSAKFEFLVGSSLAVRATAPAILDSVYGIRARLVAASEQTPAGRAAPMMFDLSTNLVFRNHVQ
jgi:prepilin-type N-terminal cleavage/methylation domain-containing protein